MKIKFETRTDTASNVNRLGQILYGLETVVLRGESILAANKKIQGKFKKGGFVCNPNFSASNNHFGLSNSCASKPQNKKIRLSLMRYRKPNGGSAKLKLTAGN